MLRVGLVGWRGMVGSVLIERMLAEKDFTGFEPLFFSTSQAGQKAPDLGFDLPPLADAYDTKSLAEMDILVSCQGGSYTEKVIPELQSSGWSGYWIDAASTLRMKEDSIIVLDPINRDVIDQALQSGTKNYIGGNCTVSLMLMALGGLLKSGYVEWITTMTYQAASGAGAKNMRELVEQIHTIGESVKELISNPSSAALTLDQQVAECLRTSSFPTEQFGAPLAASLIPWIDRPMEDGSTREEWKGFCETNKILNTKEQIPVDGICVRIGAMRCHSQAFTIKLKEDLPLEEINNIIAGTNEWVRIIPNNKEDTLRELSPAAVTGTLTVPIGRIRKMNLGPQYLTAFSVGDQLLWGAAEPLRRVLKIVLQHLGA